MPKKKYNVSPEEFVIAWQSCETAQEVADKLGMPKTNVLARANSYRSRGVQLKKLKRSVSQRVSVKSLNGLTESDDAA